MNTYPPNLFDIWPGDQTPTQLPVGPHVASLFRGLYDRTCHELAWLAATVKSIKQQEDENIFDQLYRRNHILYGLAAMLGLPKVVHLLALLDFAFDYARESETFARHSMDYVVQLLIDTTQGVFDDFNAAGRCQRELADVLEECRTYLDAPFQQCLAPLAGQAPPPSASADMAAETPLTVAPPDSAETAGPPSRLHCSTARTHTLATALCGHHATAAGARLSRA